MYGSKSDMKLVDMCTDSRMFKVKVPVNFLGIVSFSARREDVTLDFVSSCLNKISYIPLIVRIRKFAERCCVQGGEVAQEF